MKTLILFIASLAAVLGQGFRLNPITGQLDLVGGYVAPSGYSATVTAQTTTTVTAASHGQGTAPVAYCFDNASPANAMSCAYTVSSIGDVVFTWSPAFTGSVIIRGPGADAGAAGNVVGPASSTAGAVAFYSGTSGKVLTQAPTGLFYDSANVRFGVGTGSPNARFHAASNDANAVALFSGTTKGIRFNTGASSSTIFGVDNTGFGSFQPIYLDGTVVGFSQLGTERARFAATTGNLLIGTTTDDGLNKLQLTVGDSSGIAVTSAGTVIHSSTPGGGGAVVYRNTTGSGLYWQNSSQNMMWLTGGTLQLQNTTPTTGSTLLVVQAGAGQSTNNLQEWRNNAGTVLSRITSSGGFVAPTVQVDGGFYLGSTSAQIYFWGGSSNNTGLARAADGYVKVTDGSSGLGRIVVSQSTPAASTDACTAGALWADASYVYACTASGTIKRATLNTF
jgi:hypothetical protein